MILLDDFETDLENCRKDKACGEILVSSVNIHNAKTARFLDTKKCNASQIKVKEDGDSTCKEMAYSSKTKLPFRL